MNVRRRQVVRVLLLVAVAAIPGAGAAQLNPTVKVLPRAVAAIPSECTVGQAEQPAPRLAPEEKAVIVRDTAADMQAPPSATLRGELRAAFDASQSGDRDGFRDSLSRAKKILSTYPPGGERIAATEVVNVFDDLDKVWDYQFSSSTGSFFDAGSGAFRAANKYPGYEAFIRRQVIADQNGNRFYPTRETRDFLISESGDRLARLTGRPAPPRPPARGTVIPAEHRIPTTAPGSGTTTQQTTATRPATSGASRTTTTHRATTTTTRTDATTKPKRSSLPSSAHKQRRAVTQEARVTAVPEPRTKTTRHKPTTSMQAPASTHASSSAPSTHASTTQPEAKSTSVPATATATGTVDTSAPPSSTVPTTSTAPATSSEVSSTTDTTSSTGKTRPQTKSFFWPIVLIIAGLCALVLLLRASS